MPTDRSKSNASKAFSTALRILTRRDRSETELRQKLYQVGFPVAAVDSAIAKCREYNYLDDHRYATERARALMRSGRGVGPKIALDLRRRGLDEVTLQQALACAESEFSVTELLRNQFHRRFPSFDYATADNRERRRVVSFFQRRGFSMEHIFTILKEESS